MSWNAKAAFAGVSAIAIASPFEMTEPVIRSRWQSTSNLEAVVLVVFAAWVAATVRDRALPIVRTPLTWPWIALLAAMFAAALAAPVARANALHMTARLTAAFGIFILAVNAIDSPARLRRALTVAVGAGTVVAVLALLEYLQVAAVLQWLKAFRPFVAVVGAQARAGGPLQYPTIASMYLEIAFAFGLALLLIAVDRARPAAIAAAFVGLAIIGEAITLTFTRAGLLTMAASLALVGGIRWRQRRWDRGMTWLAALALVIAAAFGASRSAQSLWLRLTSEGQEAWYRFAVQAPEEMTLATGAAHAIPVTVTNTGRLTWDSAAAPRFYLSYHWLEADADRVVIWEGPRTTFPAPVAPGASASVEAVVHSPGQPGRYRLAWDVVQEGRLWFSTEPGATLTISQATVSGPHVDLKTPGTRPLPHQAVRPGRAQLWSAAARMFAAHPLLGVGPDNFRLLYAGYAGLRNADTRIHSNNMYIELVVGCGLVGAAALAWWLWQIGVQARNCARLALARPEFTAAMGVAAAVVAVLVHGLLDSFLSFTPTYILIALTLGFAVACVRVAETRPDANRV